MKYKFNINITDEDYYKYNEFVILRSPYGKKSMLSLRLAIVIMLGMFTVMSFVMNGVTKGTLIALIPTAALIIIMQLVLNPVMKSTLKKQLKTLKETGKPAFSPQSVVEVYDDHFFETHADGEHKVRFASVERVSVIGEKYIYIHVNSSMGYIFPRESFESEAQYGEFEAFLSERCKELNRYKK